ncbi:MAG: hypothetical protein NVSMB14_11520 [Isosphaeraceae bacterium]
MSYSDFNLAGVTTRFELTITDRTALFDSVAEVEPSALLREFLSRNVPLATAIHTEKARSELIVAPLLVELVERFKGKISFFSGVELNADPEKGLNGVCDFILARSPVQHILRRPVAIIVEAKRDCIPDGLGQCIAAMLGARRMNEMEHKPLRRVHGAVTTGTHWKFLRLQGETISIDTLEYYIDRVGKILGILSSMLEDEPDEGRLVA